MVAGLNSLIVLVPNPHYSTGEKQSGGKDEALQYGDRARNAFQTGEGEENHGCGQSRGNDGVDDTDGVVNRKIAGNAMADAERQNSNQSGDKRQAAIEQYCGGSFYRQDRSV